MEVTIERNDGNGNRYSQSYSVPLECGECTAMDVLDYISQWLDGTLAYYKHSSCNQGICGRCGLRVNGKPALACVRVIREDSIRLEALTDHAYKDLLVLNKKEE